MFEPFFFRSTTTNLAERTPYTPCPHHKLNRSILAVSLSPASGRGYGSFPVQLGEPRLPQESGGRWQGMLERDILPLVSRYLLVMGFRFLALHVRCVYVCFRFVFFCIMSPRFFSSDFIFYVLSIEKVGCRFVFRRFPFRIHSLTSFCTRVLAFSTGCPIFPPSSTNSHLHRFSDMVRLLLVGSDSPSRV